MTANLTARTERIARRIGSKPKQPKGKPWWADASVLYAVEGLSPNAIGKRLGVFRGSVVHALKMMDLWGRVPR